MNNILSIKAMAYWVNRFGKTPADVDYVEFYLNNSDAVLEMLQRFNEDLSDLQKAIRKKDGDKLYSFFSRTRSIRKKIIDAGQI